MAIIEMEKKELSNFQAALQDYPEEMSLFINLDQLYERTVSLIKPDEGPHLVQVPLFLLAHRLVQSAVLELTRGKAMEAVAIFRGALEAAGQAHRIHRVSHCLKVWICKADNVQLFKEEFGSKKMFPAGHHLMAELMPLYEVACEAGSHINPVTFAMRVAMIKKDSGGELRVEYIDKRDEVFEIFLVWFLRGILLILDAFVDIFSNQVREVLAWSGTRSMLQGQFDSIQKRRNIQLRHALQKGAG
jgi:hypothetical protein